MSLVQFDEVYEICCEMADVKVIKPVKPVIPAEDEHYWWEEAVREVLNKKEKEKEDIFIMS